MAPKSPRFHGYNALLVFSIVSIAAVAASLPDQKSTKDKWVISVASISIILSLFAVVAHLVDSGKEKFVGTKLEGFVSTLLLFFWVAGLPVIMNPNNDIAVQTIAVGSTTILNTNLYFSSWICLGLSMWIWGHYAQEAAGKDVASKLSPKIAKWFCLVACSIVLLASSSKYHKDNGCTNGSSTCRRNNYAISLGCVGIIIGLAMAALTRMGKLAILTEVIVSTLSLILFTFGVGYITFGAGPAITIGNLYFSAWLSFSVCVSLFSECVREFVASLHDGLTETEETPTAKREEGP